MPQQNRRSSGGEFISLTSIHEVATYYPELDINKRHCKTLGIDCPHVTAVYPDTLLLVRQLEIQEHNARNDDNPVVAGLICGVRISVRKFEPGIVIQMDIPSDNTCPELRRHKRLPR